MFSTQFIKDLIDIFLILGLIVAMWAIGSYYNDKRDEPVKTGLGTQYQPELK